MKVSHKNEGMNQEWGRRWVWSPERDQRRSEAGEPRIFQAEQGASGSSRPNSGKWNWVKYLICFKNCIKRRFILTVQSLEWVSDRYHTWTTKQVKSKTRGLPWWSVAGTVRSQGRGPGSVPGWGAASLVPQVKICLLQWRSCVLQLRCSAAK